MRVASTANSARFHIMRDTTDEAEQVRLAAIRRMTPAQRLRQALDHSEAMRRVTLSALRRRYPECSDRELAERLRPRESRAESLGRIAE